MAEDSLLQEARLLSELLLDSSEHAREIFTSIAAELEVPVSIARALCAFEGPALMSELASKLHCDKSYVTTLVDQLEELSLMNRVPGADRRTKVLELTAKGTSLRNKLESRVAKLSPAMQALNAAERKTLEGLLSKIARAGQ